MTSHIEKPRDLREEMFFSVVREFPELGSPITWKGAKLAEFKKLEAQGFRKFRQELPTELGKLVMHYWWNGDPDQPPLHLKLKASPLDSGARPS